MLDELDALAALDMDKTMGQAANRLRITQSAISKRIGALSERVGVALLERDGRRVRLTPAAVALLERTRPLVRELRETLAAPGADSGGRLIIGVSESVLASWGPTIFAQVRERLPLIEVSWAAHRSLVAIERVRAGECHVALCAGGVRTGAELAHVALGNEPCVLVASEPLPRLTKRSIIEVITIEEGSASWQSMRVQLRRLRQAGYRITVSSRVQSFAAVTQLSLAGFGLGLVPIGIARALSSRHFKPLPASGVSRPISLFARPRTLARSAVSQWVSIVQKQTRTLLS